MVAGGTGIRVVPIAFQVHHAAFVDAVAVMPDHRIVVVVMCDRVVVVSPLQRVQPFARFAVVIGVFRACGREPMALNPVIVMMLMLASSALTRFVRRPG